MIEIEVTKDDIYLGVPRGHSCPISLASERVMDGDVMTHRSVMRRLYFHPNTGEKMMAEYALPPEARTFIYRFDEGLEVEPFIFQVEDAEVISIKDLL